MERHHNFEILFYEHIGIKRFKRLVLSFEAFRRRKTGGETQTIICKA